MGDRVPPRRHSTVGPQEVAVPGLELGLCPFSDGLPFDGGVRPPRLRLGHFATGHAEQEGLVGGGEVLVVAALEADEVLGVRHKLDGPAGVLGGSVSILGDRLLVFLGHEVLVMVATEAHRLRVVKELHSRAELVGIGLPPRSQRALKIETLG